MHSSPAGTGRAGRCCSPAGRRTPFGRAKTSKPHALSVQSARMAARPRRDGFSSEARVLAGDREQRDCRRSVRSTRPGICARSQSQPERRRHAGDVRPAYGGRTLIVQTEHAVMVVEHRDSRSRCTGVPVGGDRRRFIHIQRVVADQRNDPRHLRTAKSTIRQARRQRMVRTRVMGLNSSRRILGEDRRFGCGKPATVLCSPCHSLRHRGPRLAVFIGAAHRVFGFRIVRLHCGRIRAGCGSGSYARTREQDNRGNRSTCPGRHRMK